MNDTRSVQPLNWDDCQNLLENDAQITAALERVASLDFSMLKRKLGEEKGWSPEYQSEVEDLYRRFLALNIIYRDQKICPTGPIDDFWHAHILDTRAYESDCQDLFGEYLHHFPYLVLVQTAKGIGDNGIWRIAKLNGILYLPDVGSKTTSFSSAFAGIFASN